MPDAVVLPFKASPPWKAPPQPPVVAVRSDSASSVGPAAPTFPPQPPMLPHPEHLNPDVGDAVQQIVSFLMNLPQEAVFTLLLYVCCCISTVLSSSNVMSAGEHSWWLDNHNFLLDKCGCEVTTEEHDVIMLSAVDGSMSLKCNIKKSLYRP